MVGINNIIGSVPVPPAGNPQPGAPVRGEAAAQPPASNASAAELQNSADKVQQMLSKAAPYLNFSVDKGSGRTVIKVVDPATNEVLRQFPNEEILRMGKSLDQMMEQLKGLLIDRHG